MKILLLILLLVIMNISIEQLTNLKISGAEILFIRAVFNFGLAVLVAVKNRETIIPQKPKLQIGTFLLFGLGMLLNFSAYQYISAGSVSTLQRLDIPLLVLVSFLYSPFNGRKGFLAVLSFLVVGLMIFYSRNAQENVLGYVLIIFSVIVLVINTLLQKKIAVKENIATIMAVVSLSSLFWGGIRCWQSGADFQKITPMILGIIFGLAVINLIIFYLVNELYKKYPAEFVRYPYLISAFAIMIVEMLIKQKWETPVVIFGNIAILIIITFLVGNKSKNPLTYFRTHIK